MRPLLLDTNAYTSFKQGEKSIVEILQLAEIIGFTPIVMSELMAGFDGGNKAKQNKIEFQKFLESPRVKIYAITHDTAHFFSQIFCSLKRKGKPIPTNDIWIAAQALEHGCVVCTFDKHFSLIEGLIAGNSAADLFLLRVFNFFAQHLFF